MNFSRYFTFFYVFLTKRQICTLTLYCAIVIKKQKSLEKCTPVCYNINVKKNKKRKDFIMENEIFKIEDGVLIKCLDKNITSILEAVI